MHFPIKSRRHESRGLKKEPCLSASNTPHCTFTFREFWTQVCSSEHLKRVQAVLAVPAVCLAPLGSSRFGSAHLYHAREKFWLCYTARDGFSSSHPILRFFLSWDMPELNKSHHQNSCSSTGPSPKCSLQPGSHSDVCKVPLSPTSVPRARHNEGRCHLKSSAASPRNFLGRAGGKRQPFTQNYWQHFCRCWLWDSPCAGTSGCPDPSCSIRPLDAPASHAVCRAVPAAAGRRDKAEAKPREKMEPALCQGFWQQVLPLEPALWGTRGSPEWWWMK